jgi:hypothetical protein
VAIEATAGRAGVLARVEVAALERDTRGVRMIDVTHYKVWGRCRVQYSDTNNIGHVHYTVACECGWTWRGYVPVFTIAHEVAVGHEELTVTYSWFDLHDLTVEHIAVRSALGAIALMDRLDLETLLLDLERAMVNLVPPANHATLGLLCEAVNRRMGSWSRLDAPEQTDP